ncbi:MAG: F0F1 ATP synthase subunit A [Actinomycetia bacterium]|nr:F0F1 ATP synthase subunit A [Actinomycetes bacterium]
MTAWVRVEESEGFAPPDARAFDLPPLFDSVEWLTKPALQIVLSVVIISAFFLLTTRRISVVPGRLQFAAEGVYGFVRNTIARDIIGSHDFRAFLPLLLTLFTFIYVNNVFGVIPLIQFPTMSHIAFPVVLAMVVWVVFNYVGIKRKGFVVYFKGVMFPPGVPGWVYVLLAPIELVSTIIIRPLTMAVRLFANMFAGHMLILVFMLGAEYMLIEGGAVLKAISVVPFALGIGITFFELLIQFLQAYVFVLLTALYIAGAISEEH